MNIKNLLKQLTAEEKASLCSGKDFWHTKNLEGFPIDSVMMCDGPNGVRKQTGESDHLGLHESIKAVCFPTASAIASSFDVEVARELGETLGKECQAEGVGMLLGPGVNIKRSPLCGRNFEYYSEDPYQSSQMAAAFIEGIQSEGVGACIKHYAANNQESHRQTGNSVVDERTLHEIYLACFEEAVKKAKPWGVMCSYNQINGVFAAENKLLLTDILRKKWEYDGMVVTDWGAVKNRVKGIEAGLDLEMPGGPGSLANDARIVEAIKQGKLSEEELDKAAGNVLRFIEKVNEGKKENVAFDYEADYQTARRIAGECAVLLKNDRKILPLSEGKKIAFIGSFAEHPRIQGSGSSYINSMKVPSIQELVQNNPDIMFAEGFAADTENSACCSWAGAVDHAATEFDSRLCREAVSLARECDVAVIFAGLHGKMEAEGADRTHMDLPEEQNHLIAEVCRVQPDTVVVLSNGAPVTMPWVQEVPAILEMYLAGDGASEATLDLLFGRVNPSGKLAESFPLRLEDTSSYLNFPGENGVVHYNEDIFVGYRYYDRKKMPVLFPFGHGLSYTTFSYSNLRIAKGRIRDNESTEVTVTVTNTGCCPGKEAVQLYTGAKKSTVRRPVRELKGFRKIMLLPGESKDVTFTLDKRSFAYYETAIHDWFVEGGSYEIAVGTSSRELPLQGEIEVESTQVLPLNVTLNTSIGELIRHPATAPVMQKLIQQSMERQHNGNLDADAAAIGTSKESMIAGAMEMPIGALATFGIMPEEQLSGLIAMLQESIDNMRQ